MEEDIWAALSLVKRAGLVLLKTVAVVNTMITDSITLRAYFFPRLCILIVLFIVAAVGLNEMK